MCITIEILVNYTLHAYYDLYTNVSHSFSPPRLDGSVCQLMLLILYIPLGILLLLLRLFISLQLILAVTILPQGATLTRCVV